MRLLWDNKSGVTKRWTVRCMPTRHYVCPCNAGSLIWLYWQKSREEETTRPTLKELAAKLSGGVNGYSR